MDKVGFDYEIFDEFYSSDYTNIQRYLRNVSYDQEEGKLDDLLSQNLPSNKKLDQMLEHPKVQDQDAALYRIEGDWAENGEFDAAVDNIAYVAALPGYRGVVAGDSETVEHVRKIQANSAIFNQLGSMAWHSVKRNNKDFF